MKQINIEDWLSKTGHKWKRIMKDMWAVEGGEGKTPQVTVSIEHDHLGGLSVLKFVVFICDVPHDVEPKFFVDFLKLNFRVEHGAFAMESRSEMIFTDSLELDNLDENEFTATLDVLLDAPRIFREHYDIDFFTMGAPQY